MEMQRKRRTRLQVILPSCFRFRTAQPRYLPSFVWWERKTEIGSSWKTPQFDTLERRDALTTSFLPNAGLRTCTWNTLWIFASPGKQLDPPCVLLKMVLQIAERVYTPTTLKWSVACKVLTWYKLDLLQKKPVLFYLCQSLISFSPELVEDETWSLVLRRLDLAVTDPPLRPRQFMLNIPIFVGGGFPYNVWHGDICRDEWKVVL